MHELAVTESILNIATEYAKRAEAKRVMQLYLVIGQLASIVDDSVQFYWDTISLGTICEGSQLHFERVPASLTCLDCGTNYTLTDELTVCPQCQSGQVRIVAGEEFRLDSIEIET